MASYRQLPEVFRRLHPRFKTPWLVARRLRRDRSRSRSLLPGRRRLRRHDVLVRRDALVHGRARGAGPAAHARRHEEDLLYRARPNLRLGGVDWPLFAVFGGIATAIAWLVIVVQNPATRWVGLGWLVVGFVGYVVYRRRFVRAPLRRRSSAAGVRPGARARVPTPARADRVAVRRRTRPSTSPRAWRPSGGRRSRPSTCSRCRSSCRSTPSCRTGRRSPTSSSTRRARIGESYGVARHPAPRPRRAAPAPRSSRRRGGAAPRSSSSARRKDAGRRRRAVFGDTVDYVLKQAPCRVMVVARRRTAA